MHHLQDDNASSYIHSKARSSGPTGEQQSVTDQPSPLTQSKEADVKALYEMTCILDKKVIIVFLFTKSYYLYRAFLHIEYGFLSNHISEADRMHIS